MRSTKAQQILDLLHQVGVLRSRDLNTLGIPREYLRRLCKRGLIKRIARGLYTLPEVTPDVHESSLKLHEERDLYFQVIPSEYRSFVETAQKVPHGIICLLSALRFHDLTTQSPFEVWVAIDVKARRPKVDGVPIRIVRFSGPALEAGIEEHMIEGVRVRVYNPAKTVADCFKYRHKIGLDVAIHALRDCRRQNKCHITDLVYYAKVCRVLNVMRPYLEMEAIT